MFAGWIKGMLDALPSQCLVCHRWPSQPFCEDCVSRFAQPHTRCQTCALPIPSGLWQCGACITNPPALDVCLAAVSYDSPWADLIVDFKFRQHPGRASAGLNPTTVNFGKFREGAATQTQQLTVSNLTPLDYITGSTFRNGTQYESATTTAHNWRNIQLRLEMKI